MEAAQLASVRVPAARLVVALGRLEESRRTTKRLVMLVLLVYVCVCVYVCMCVCVCVCV